MSQYSRDTSYSGNSDRYYRSRSRYRSTSPSDRRASSSRSLSRELNYAQRWPVSPPRDREREYDRFDYVRDKSHQMSRHRRPKDTVRYRSRSPVLRDLKLLPSYDRNVERDRSPRCRYYGSMEHDQSPGSIYSYNMARDRSPSPKYDQSVALEYSPRPRSDTSIARDYSHRHSYDSSMARDRRSRTSYDRSMAHHYSPWSSHDRSIECNRSSRSNYCSKDHRGGKNVIYDWVESTETRNKKSRHFNIRNKSNKENLNAPPSPVICTFYNTESNCRYGDSCPFVHLCKYFVKEECRYGSVCKRSHNIFDKQPRSVLEKYELIPMGYISGGFENQSIIKVVKQKLKKENNNIYKYKTKPALDRPLISAESLEKTLSEVDSDEESSSFDKDDETLSQNGFESFPADDLSEKKQSKVKIKQEESLGDYIPLKTEPDIQNIKREKKETKSESKRGRKDKKVISYKTERQPDKLVPNQDCGKSEDNKTTQLSITFESQLPNRNIRVRRSHDQWQISSMTGPWCKLSEADSKVFSKLYSSAFEITKKVLPRE